MLGVSQHEKQPIPGIQGKTKGFASPTKLVPWLKTPTQVLKEKTPPRGDHSVIQKDLPLDQNACRRANLWNVTKKRRPEKHIPDDSLVLMTPLTSGCYSKNHISKDWSKDIRVSAKFKCAAKNCQTPWPPLTSDSQWVKEKIPLCWCCLQVTNGNILF